MINIAAAYSQAQIDTASTVVLAENQEVYQSFNEGLKELKSNHYLQAIEHFSEAIAKKNDFYQAYNGRASAYLLMKDYSNAMLNYKSALKYSPKDPGIIYYNLAIAFQSSSMYDSAVIHFKNADMKGYKNSKVYYNMGFSYYKLMKYKESLSAYDKAVLADPNYVEAYNDRGSCKKQFGDLDGALADYTLAIDKDPRPMYYANRGSIYRKLKLYGEAIDDYSYAISKQPDFYIAYNNRGSAKYDKGDYVDALEDFKKAIIIKADYAPAYNNLGSTYYLIERYNEALQALNKAVTIDQKYGYAYFNRANVKEALNDIQGAIDDWQKASSLGLKFAEKNISDYKK